jgi:hypothetical protein
MINTLSVEPEQVYQICETHFLNAGISLKPAKGTPLKLSYIWKHVKTLTNKFNEWEFSADEIDAYIRIVSNRLSTLPPRQRSIQFAVKAEMLEYCNEELERQQEDGIHLLDQIKRSHKWFQSVAGTDFQSQVDHLTQRYKPGALPNVVVYYQQGRLSKQYIAFSKSCRQALLIIGQQDISERSFCPNDAALHFITDYKLINHSVSIRQALENC